MSLSWLGLIGHYLKSIRNQTLINHQMIYHP